MFSLKESINDKNIGWTFVIDVLRPNVMLFVNLKKDFNRELSAFRIKSCKLNDM